MLRLTLSLNLYYPSHSEPIGTLNIETDALESLEDAYLKLLNTFPRPESGKAVANLSKAP